ncbi:hypothetical protein [Mesorhizobium sp. M0571]|uniref:hypothetical protein n=1 Tax=Mesorhizobium sp. M0571 TaxID=2956960 RepID=UPI00333772B9
MDHIRFVRLDIHKERISVAESGRCGSVDYLDEIANDANEQAVRPSRAFRQAAGVLL